MRLAKFLPISSLNTMNTIGLKAFYTLILLFRLFHYTQDIEAVTPINF